MDWALWAPPLDPPEAGGLPAAVAEEIAVAHEGCDPHLVAALLWETWAGMLPPAPAIASVSTGVQSVSYAGGADGGRAGLALARAAWHRSFLGGELLSVPLAVPAARAVPGDWPGSWDLEEP